MKYLLLIFFIFCLVSAMAQKQTAIELRQEMARIRKSTNWDDPESAKKANEKIKLLSRQLMMTTSSQFPSGSDNSQRAAHPSGQTSEEVVDTKMKFISQMMKGAGKDADILFAEPFREEITEAYKEEESPKNIRPEVLKEMTVLVIDMSLPTVQRTIDIMQNYKSIKTLVITGGEKGAFVNLPDLLRRASQFPLQSLYIINFRQFVTSIPSQINQFKNLSTLALFNNKIGRLPDMNELSSSLETLFIDINPIGTLFPSINPMNKLKILGLAKTAVSESEISRIKQLLPKCQIQTK